MNTRTDVKQSSPPENGGWSRIDFSRGGGIIIAFIVLCAVLSFASPHFLTLENLMTVARQTVFVMLIGFAMTFVIGMGGIDLSVGAILALCGAVAAKMLLTGSSVSLTIITALALGTFIGVLNGLMVAILGITDFIATLGTMSVLRGVIMVFTHGVPFFGLQIAGFQWLAQGYVGPVPVPVIITTLLFLLCLFVLRKMRLGRYLLAIGSNKEAAGLVGINVKLVKIVIYAISGFFCAISGLLLTSRLEAAMPEAGLGYELDVIAAVIIGGTSLSGGRANLLGTVVGAMVMGVVRNGLNLLQINVFWHQVVIGTIILIAVGIDRLSQRRISK
jgi:ribose transport system permease protein